MSLLEVVDGQGRRRQVALDRPRLLIGREPSCDIHLGHPGVSRCHAQLQLTENGTWLLQDLHSRNHVYVDNKPVQQMILEPDKPFRIAEYWLIFKRKEQPAAAPEEPAPSIEDDTLESVWGQQAAWLDQLQAFHRSLTTLVDPRQVLESLAREVQRILQPQLVAIGLVKPEGYGWEILHGQNPHLSLSACLEEARGHVAEDHSSVQNWAASSGAHTANDTPSPSLCLLFPMKGRRHILGHLFIHAPAYENVPQAMQRFLGLIAHHAALVWDNLHLMEARQSQLAMEKELEHARQIQTGLFPPTFRVDPRLDAHAINLPSARVSGDYYDLFRTGPDSVAFVIADAMGHGMPAALLMAAVRAALRMGLTLHLSWKEIFKGLDDLISQARADTFVTGMVGLLDLASSELRLVLAGHPAPSILVDGKPLAVPSTALTRPWGLELETPWEVGLLCLGHKPWSILCYTDGITDAVSSPPKLAAVQRVARFHKKNYQLSAEDLCQALLDKVAHSQSRADTLGDDQTVLALCSAPVG